MSNLMCLDTIAAEILLTPGEGKNSEATLTESMELADRTVDVDEDEISILRSDSPMTGSAVNRHEQTPKSREAHERVSDRRLLAKEIPGLNARKGIERFNGNEETYLSILRSYVTNTSKQLDSMTDMCEDKLDDYATTVHGIAGASYGICADRIGNLARNLEKAAQSGDYSHVASHNQEFLDAARKLIHDIIETLSVIDAENPKPKKDKPDQEVLVKLIAACKEYDIDGVYKAISEIDKYQYENDNSLADWIKENIKHTNYKQVVERLSK